MRVSCATALLLAAAASPLCAAVTLRLLPDSDPEVANVVHAVLSDPAVAEAIAAASIAGLAVIQAAGGEHNRATVAAASQAAAAASRAVFDRKAREKASREAFRNARKAAAAAFKNSFSAASASAAAGARNVAARARLHAAAALSRLEAASVAVKSGAQLAKDYVVAHPRLAVGVAGVAAGAASGYASQKYLLPSRFRKPAPPAEPAAPAEPAGDAAPFVPVPIFSLVETFDEVSGPSPSTSSSSGDEPLSPETAAVEPAPFSVETLDDSDDERARPEAAAAADAEEQK